MILWVFMLEVKKNLLLSETLAPQLPENKPFPFWACYCLRKFRLRHANFPRSSDYARNPRRPALH